MKSDAKKILVLFAMVIITLSICNLFLKNREVSGYGESEAYYNEPEAYYNEPEVTYNESEAEAVYSEPEYILSQQDALYLTKNIAMKTMIQAKSQGMIYNYSFYLSDVTETETTIDVVTQINIWSYQHGGSPDTRWNASAIFDKYTGECISFNIS